MGSWRDGYGGAFRMGLEHGVYCLGCCWLLFVILFPLGVMNVAVMALLTLLIFAEKSLPIGPQIAKITAAALIVFGRGTWAEGTCEPEKFLTNVDKVVVYLHVWVRLKDSPDWVGGRFADGFVFRDGKITQYLSFGERLDALKWAGIVEQETI